MEGDDSVVAISPQILERRANSCALHFRGKLVLFDSDSHRATAVFPSCTLAKGFMEVISTRLGLHCSRAGAEVRLRWRAE